MNTTNKTEIDLVDYNNPSMQLVEEYESFNCNQNQDADLEQQLEYYFNESIEQNSKIHQLMLSVKSMKSKHQQKVNELKPFSLLPVPGHHHHPPPPPPILYTYTILSYTMPHTILSYTTTHYPILYYILSYTIPHTILYTIVMK